MRIETKDLTLMANNNGNGKYLESWIWGAACSIHGAKDVLKYKDFIRPMILTKRLCDVFDDEVNRIAGEGGSRKKAFQLVKADHKLVRFFCPCCRNTRMNRSGRLSANSLTGSVSSVNLQPASNRSIRKSLLQAARKLHV